MKHASETKNMKKIYNHEDSNEEMPHINSQDTGNMNEIEDYENYLGMRHKQNQEGFEPNPQMFNYNFFEDSTLSNVYVNVKQLGCIKKRKMRRDYLDTLMVPPRNSYLHESRHRHAMKRLRAPSGRFLTKEETEEFLKKQDFENKEDL
ncbi:Nuclear transcription factor Y subunit A-1 [Nosema granulosis]|uniref:Transcriptional activator HAP2 n=1 Tax=Nosema granulosis TaxID=83296 RepID=A0A9P6KYS5_9MICR|nr:Nuclear transcription factor Y subunit A-1 [Nosema granulosis]